jgi:NAD(P)-dependent dehydrogenase (short-subunit alcohol dehydrogenase family)
MVRAVSHPGLLEGKVVLVSGVGPGLGRSCARAVLDGGGLVAMGDLDADRVASIAKELDPDQQRTIALGVDIAKAEDSARMAAAIRERWGRLDGLVHVAALDTPVGGLEDGDLDDWDRVSRVNVRGTLELTKATLDLLGQGSSIVVIGSIGAVRPRLSSLRLAYGTSKGALVTAARYLATELGPRGVRVNTVAPGWKWGPVLAGYVEQVAADSGRPVDEILDKYRAEAALRDIADDDDVADTVVYFLSDLSRKVSGQTLHVDAGGFFH